LRGDQEQIVRLLHPAHCTHPAGELDLRQLGCLPQHRQDHGVGPVGLRHVTADPRDISRDGRMLGKLGDAVVTVDEPDFLRSSGVPLLLLAQPRIHQSLTARGRTD
jgi:hypothetical protein